MINKIFNFIINLYYRFSKKKISYQQFDNIIISHVVSKNINFENDFYFGSLARDLNKKKSLIIFINHIPNLNIKLKYNRFNFIIIPNFFISFLYFALFFKFFLFESKNVKILNFFQNINFKNILLNYKISSFVSFCIKNFNPSRVFFTYEGYLYERLICSDSYKFSKKVMRIGYQFSSIKKSSKNIFKNMKEEYNPDCILTINDFYKNKLNKSEIGKVANIYSIGTLRSRSEKKFLVNKSQVNKNNILIIPEGINKELDLFLRFFKKFKNSKYYNFNLRLHPIYKEKFSNMNLKKITNIVSNNFLQEIRINNFVLYRGSSFVIEYIKYGIIPIYLKDGGENRDPLFFLNKYHKFNCNQNVSSFENLIKKLSNPKKKSIAQERLNFINFSKKFYKKYNKKKLLQILNIN